MIISIDTETTGLDLYYGCRPFLISVCFSDRNQVYWDWPVNPETREVIPLPQEVKEIQELVLSADRIVFHNAKFDITALQTVGITVPWEKVEDTVVADHVLVSGYPHYLTDLTIRYLNRDISPLEEDLKEEVARYRRLVRREHPTWKIAGDGLEGLPSVRNEGAGADYWLPKTYQEYHHQPITSVLLEYANTDSLVTLEIWEILQKELRRQNLEKTYRARMRVLPALHRMEQRGITAIPEKIHEQVRTFQEEHDRHVDVCLQIGRSYYPDFRVPASSVNNQVRQLFLHHWNYPIYKKTEKGNPSFDSEVLEYYLLRQTPEHKEGTIPHRFVQSLVRKNDYSKALSMLDTYQRYLSPTDGRTIHSSFNLTGTVTTRLSSANPNAQQVSKLAATNLRQCFGPAPGRVWFSLDAENIELRIPAYEADERDLIEIFDHPEKPPYYGKYHLLIFDVLYPDIFAKLGKHVKEPESEGGYGSTLYQRVKNGNFARQYGAQERKVDATYGLEGAYRKVAQRFPRIDKLSRYYIDFANRHGYVETLHDRVLDAHYRIMTERSQYGKVSPTVPFCYHISGTAGWWMNRAIVKCDDALLQWRRDGFDGYMILTVHDELVFDFPADHPQNLEKIREIKRLMESCGEDIGIPTPVSVEKHVVDWSVGETLKL